jgi:hypothetical protein
MVGTDWLADVVQPISVKTVESKNIIFTRETNVLAVISRIWPFSVLFLMFFN